MHITMVGAECAPAAKIGGLGDFVQGLAHALSAAGHEVEVILPRYDCLRFDLVGDLSRAYEGLEVPFDDGRIVCDVESGTMDGIRCLFVRPDSQQGFFDRGVVYGEPDDAERFGLFSRAVLELLQARAQRPDVIHCHDWQTGLVPVLFHEAYAGFGDQGPGVCYTLHNVGYQGVVGEHVLRQVGLDPARVMRPDRLLDPGSPRAANLMKGGIVYSSFVTTVSPRYAWEIQSTPQGMGLEPVLRAHGDRFAGILNGIDDETWNPETDRHIARNFGVGSLPEKAKNRSDLRRQLGLDEVRKPLVSVVSRLDRQKGVDLIAHAVRHALARDCQVVLLGSAQDPEIASRFDALKQETLASPDCHLELGYDEELAHRIYAGADIIVIPSVYEPCGLTQMIAMKYGAVPVVRRVGGLADTVFDANFSDKPFEARNGFLFDDLTPEGLESALDRAIGLWYQYPQYFRQLRVNGMHADHSWSRPAQQYLDVYARICESS